VTQRVLVTGLGVVTPFATNLDVFWQALCHGPGRFAPARALPQRPIVVSEFDGADAFLSPHGVTPSACDRTALMAVTAMWQALADAGLARQDIAGPRTAVIVGCGGGGLRSIDEQFRLLYAQGKERAHPFSVPKAMGSSTASWMSIASGATGPCFVTSSACASATHAIGTALQLIRHGIVDRAITGGTESSLDEGSLRAWAALKIMSPDLCRPFSRDRKGLLLAEGAACLILESEAAARGRGALPHAELAGFGCSADAADMLSPSAAGMAAATRAALGDAGLDAGAIDYVNAHGTGTTANDRCETMMLRDIFGPADMAPPVSSIKAVTGHALGAAGAVEAVATCLAIRNGVAPPTLNYLGSDPDCDLDYIVEGPRPLEIGHALSNSFGFGGLNAALVLARAR